MEDTRYEPPRTSFSSMASSAMMRGASSGSTENEGLQTSDGEHTPNKKSRGFLDRVLGRTPSAGHHRAAASMSVATTPLLPNLNPPWEARQRVSADLPRPSSKGASLSLEPVASSKSGTGSQTPPAPSPTHVSSSGVAQSTPSLTLNNLSNTERAERVKRNRKLMQILGNEISRADAFIGPDVGDEGAPPIPMHLRGAFMGTSNHNISSSNLSDSESFTNSKLMQRRHSSPISANFTHEPILSPRVLRRNFISSSSKHNDDNDASSSAFDSDEEDKWFGEDEEGGSQMLVSRSPPPLPSKNDENSPPPTATASTGTRGERSLSHARSITSITNTISTVDWDYEDENRPKPEDPDRARKRATLAKLHRFLGSRIPPELVVPLGAPVSVVPVSEAGTSWSASNPTTPTASTLRKRKSTKAVLSLSKSKDGEESDASIETPKSKSRFKSHRSRKSVAATDSMLRPSSAHVPIAYMSDGDLDTRASVALTGAQRVHIMRKQKKIQKMLGHCPPGTMSQQSDFLIKGDFDGSEAQYGFLPPEPGRSKQYMQHRYSINSLTYLVKHNDQEQLQELLTYMKADDDSGSIPSQVAPSSSSLRNRVAKPSPLQNPSPSSPNMVISGGESTAPEDDNVIVLGPAPSSPPYLTRPEIESTKRDSKASSIVPPSPTDSFSFLAPPLSSFSSSPDPTAVEFQQRRKRAAKLTSFFGVEYRDLFDQVLDVIESEVKEDSIMGELSPEETQELLAKLRKLKKV